MSFLNPWFAAAVAAIVVPALLLLYFLKLRRREQVVPSTLLWKRAVQDLQVNAPFQRLRRNLLLLLQLLIVAAAILALARPIVETTVTDEARLVILIDRSASMNAREGDATRLELAKEQAVRLVKTLNRRTSGWRSFFSLAGAQAQTQVMVIAFADRATVVSPFTSNTGDLIEAIERIDPTDAPTRLREAIDLAEAYLAPPTRLSAGMEDTPLPAEAPAKLLLISDGRVPNLERVVFRGPTLAVLRVGEAQDNVGITALRTQRNYERPEQLDAFVTVANFGPQRITTDLSVYVDGVLARVESLTLAGRTAERPSAGAPAAPSADAASEGSSRSLALSLVLDRAALLEVRLSRPDSLAADNVAYAVVPPPRRQRILVVTDGKYPFLDSVIRGLPLQEYPFVTPAQYEASVRQFESEGQSNFDVVIFDKYAPSRLPGGAFMFLGALPPLPDIEPGPPTSKHMLIWWDRTHPILRHVALDYVYVAKSGSVKLPAAAEVLVEGPAGPVLFRHAAAGRHCLVLTFAIEDSTWWSKLSFGVFMYNAIRYLGGGDADAAGEPLRPGATLRIPAAPGSRTVRLLRPDGAAAELVPDALGVAYYGGTERVGIYRVEGGVPGRERFAVNLEDPHESDIAPLTGPLVTATGEVRELQAIRTATPEVWRWFAGAALVLVLFEWWVYNRRVAL